MKRSLLSVILFALALPLRAGASYRFQTRSDPGRPSLSGRVTVDPPRSRLDITSGDGLLFRDGSVVLSTDGGKSLVVLDPARGTWYPLSLEHLFAALGSMAGGAVDLHVVNSSMKVRDLGPGGIVQSYPTRHYATDSSCDITMTLLGAGTRAHVSTHSESWVTDRIDPALATFVQQGAVRSGIPELDRLMEARSSAVRGFPLRETTVTVLRIGDGKELKTSQTVTISDFKIGKAGPEAFRIPPGFRRVGSPLDRH